MPGIEAVTGLRCQSHKLFSLLRMVYSEGLVMVIWIAVMFVLSLIYGVSSEEFYASI